MPERKPRERQPFGRISGLTGRNYKGSQPEGIHPERKKEIKAVLEDLRGLEEQEFGSELRKHPSARRPSARELGFATDAPSVGEILERATIQQGLRSKKPHLMFARLVSRTRRNGAELPSGKNKQ